MVARKIKEYLDENGIKYVTITHSTAYTAQEIAASAHIPGKEMAKTVIVKTPKGMAMAVLPALHKVSLDKIRDIVGSDDVELAEEADFIDLFPGCVAGAMPPFGNLYDLDVYVDPSLAEDEEIAFNAGTHTDLIRMKFGDFERLVKPKVVKIAR